MYVYTYIYIYYIYVCVYNLFIFYMQFLVVFKILDA